MARDASACRMPTSGRRRSRSATSRTSSVLRGRAPTRARFSTPFRLTDWFGCACDNGADRQPECTCQSLSVTDGGRSSGPATCLPMIASRSTGQVRLAAAVLDAQGEQDRQDDRAFAERQVNHDGQHRPAPPSCCRSCLVGPVADPSCHHEAATPSARGAASGSRRRPAGSAGAGTVSSSSTRGQDQSELSGVPVRWILFESGAALLEGRHAATGVVGLR